MIHDNEFSSRFNCHLSCGFDEDLDYISLKNNFYRIVRKRVIISYSFLTLNTIAISILFHRVSTLRKLRLMLQKMFQCNLLYHNYDVLEKFYDDQN